MKFKNIYIGIGISGSGKSSFFKTFCPNALYLNADTIREELCGGDRSDQTKNRLVFETLYDKFERALYCVSNDIIIDNTTLTRSDRNKLYKIIEPYKHSYNIIVVYFIPNLEKAKRWNVNREWAVPEHVLYKQMEKITPPSDEEISQHIDKYYVIDLGE